MHLRGERHTTLRMLRSALAFTLAGTRTCDEIHDLYARGQRAAIVQGFYFNSWLGGDAPTTDPLLALLKELDIGQRRRPPARPHAELHLARRGRRQPVERSSSPLPNGADYDRSMLRKLFEELPGNSNGADRTGRQRIRPTSRMMRRRTFFERRDSNWTQMLPYRSASRLLALIRDGRDVG